MDLKGKQYGKDLSYLESLGLTNHRGHVHYQFPVTRLIEDALAKGEGRLSDTGALLVTTGERTGRSPQDRFVVRDHESKESIDWGKVNVPIEADHFEHVLHRAMAYLENRNLYVFDGFCGADPAYRLPIRVVNEFAWHNLFANQLFIKPTHQELKEHRPEFTVIFAPNFHVLPSIDHSRTSVEVILSFEKRVALICGTQYAGESKKSIFAVMNYLMPERGVLPMHCSANVDKETGDTALFFGLSGTGKTTLSADPKRNLVGDDEHGWSDDGIFNFEGGCYAKCIDLTEEKEPEIYRAIKFGAVLENVVADEAGVPDYTDDSITENTRAAYPLTHIPGAVIPSQGGHPKTVVFLTCDAFGVLPPISRLDRDQAMYHFMSGYTAKVAGTEAGITEPKATFSACFGSPFLPLSPVVYAEMLGKKIDKFKPEVFLVNTGWSGGPYGEAKRMDLKTTRALVTAALSGDLKDVEYEEDPIFGLKVPKSAPNVSPDILMPRKTWKDKDAYDAKAKELAKLFHENFKKYADAPEQVRQAGPRSLEAIG